MPNAKTDRMKKQVVVITGAATGIGRLTAELLARAGHVVYASMRDMRETDRRHAEAITGLAETEKLSLKPIELNVLFEESCRSAADLILAEQGRIDVVMNNAAMLVLGLTEAFRTDQVLEAFNVNAVSWVRVNRAFLPIMRRQGEGLLVYTGSSTTRMVDPFIGPYAASKAAADSLAETMHYENSQYGIESVIIMPGAYTSGTEHFAHASHAAEVSVTSQYGRINHLPEEFPARLNGMHRPGVRTDPTEVAEAVRDVIAMERGKRPFRVVVDPQQRNMEALNALHEKLQRDSFRRLGIDHLIDVRVEGSNNEDASVNLVASNS